MKIFLSVLLFLTANLIAGPGEEGRPKVIPTFEKWGEGEPEVRSGLRGSKTLVGDLLFHDLDGLPKKLKTLWAEKPVLIVHSSLTCPVSRDNCPHVDQIKADYEGRIEVVVLYTTEAHPVGSASPYSEGGNQEWITDRNIIEKFLVDEPATLEARLERARQYRDKQSIKSRLVVDNMDNEIWKMFGAGPNTGIFISPEGRVIVRHGWLKPSYMAGSIRRYFAHQRNSKVDAALEKHGHRLSSWDLKIDLIRKVAKDVPDVLLYNFRSKGVASGETLLHLAVEKNEPKLVAQLLELGAPVDCLDYYDQTPLFYALRKSSQFHASSREATIDLLLRNNASVSHRSYNLETATHMAVKSNDLGTVKRIIEAGAPLDLYSSSDISPIHEALFGGKTEIAAYLHDRGASKDIFVAAALGDLKNVKRLLIPRPLAWNSYQDYTGRSPLIYAAIAGQTEMVRFLLSQQTEELQYANEQLVACLKQSSDFQKLDTALEIVALAQPLTGENSPEPTQSLVPVAPDSRRWSPFDNPIFHEVAASKQPQLLKLMLTRGWDVDALNPDEETPLHVAVTHGGLETITVLLEAGADINARAGAQRALPCGPMDEERRNLTPLHFAVNKRNPETVALLIEKGANLNLSDDEGFPPLCYALPSAYVPEDEEKQETQILNLKKIVNLLVKAGADPNKPNASGKSYRDLLSEPIEKFTYKDREEVKLGVSPRSPELLKLLDELKAK